jgi:hypothetical protein
VHLLSLVLIILGIFLIISVFPEIPLIIWGAVVLAFGWLLLPKPEKVPQKDAVSREDFPALYAVVNDVARELGGRPIDHIAIDEDFNAAYGGFGWRRVPVLWIGLLAAFWQADWVACLTPLRLSPVSCCAYRSGTWPLPLGR